MLISWIDALCLQVWCVQYFGVMFRRNIQMSCILLFPIFSVLVFGSTWAVINKLIRPNFAISVMPWCHASYASNASTMTCFSTFYAIVLFKVGGLSPKLEELRDNTRLPVHKLALQEVQVSLSDKIAMHYAMLSALSS